MPTLHYVEMAIRNAIAEGEDFNRRLGRRASSRYPIRWEGRDFSAPAIFEESHRLYSEEAQVPLSIPRYLGGVRSPNSVGRMLIAMGVTIFDTQKDQYVDLDHSYYRSDQFDVPEPTDLILSPEEEEAALKLLEGADVERLRSEFWETQGAPTSSLTVVERRNRSRLVVAIVLGRCKGKCEACKRPAPFHRKSGVPYLEVHHVETMALGGPDHPENCVAVCPNCHREIHFGSDGRKINDQMRFDAWAEESLVREETRSGGRN